MAAYQRFRQRKQCDEKKWEGGEGPWLHTIGECAGGNPREEVAMVWVWRPRGLMDMGIRHICIWWTFTCAWGHMSACA